VRLWCFVQDSLHSKRSPTKNFVCILATHKLEWEWKYWWRRPTPASSEIFAPAPICAWPEYGKSFLHGNVCFAGQVQATLLDFCRGMSRPVNWYHLMLRHVIRHVVNMWVCEQAMWARLSNGSFFDFFSFSRHMLRYYVLSALDFGKFKRFDGSIYRNLRELSLFINTNWLWDDNRGNSYILIAFVD